MVHLPDSQRQLDDTASGPIRQSLSQNIRLQPCQRSEGPPTARSPSLQAARPRSPIDEHFRFRGELSALMLKVCHPERTADPGPLYQASLAIPFRRYYLGQLQSISPAAAASTSLTALKCRNQELKHRVAELQSAIAALPPQN